MTPWRLFKIFASVSAVTIGGGYAMIPVIKEYIVDKYKVLDEDEFMNVIAQAQTVPGVIAINTAIILGKKVSGIPGALAASLGAMLPPFFIILVVANFFENFSEISIVKGFFFGARVGVTVILANLSYQLIKKNLSNILSLIFVVFGTIAIVIYGIPSIWILVAVAILIVVFNKKGRAA